MELVAIDATARTRRVGHCGRMGKSPEGKARSSQNSTKHGLRAKNVLILPGETQEEYDEVVRGWNDYWQPADYQEEKLVATVIQNDWLHRRAQRWQLETEASVMGENGLDPLAWTAEQRHTLELVQRYKTTAERAFYRAWSALRSLGKDIMREDKDRSAMRVENERLKIWKAAHEAKAERSEPREKSETVSNPVQKPFQGQKSPKKRKKVTILDQWVEVEVSPAGKTVTTLYPSNEILLRDGEKKWPAPELVYRRLHFVHGVPHEYAWATSEEQIREAGGMGIQRMTVESWLEQIEKEKALGTGHLLPCGNLPRPEERGGCDCPTCSKNRAILEARAA